MQNCPKVDFKGLVVRRFGQRADEMAENISSASRVFCKHTATFETFQVICEISSRCLQVKEIMAQLFIRRPVVDSSMRFDGIIEIDESGQAEFAVLS